MVIVTTVRTTTAHAHARRARGPVPPHPQSTAKEEETPPKSAPARKKALEVLWAAEHKTSVRRTSRKSPRPSRAPQEVTRKTLRRAQTGREQRAAEQVGTRVLGLQGCCSTAPHTAQRLHTLAPRRKHAMLRRSGSCRGRFITAAATATRMATRPGILVASVDHELEDCSPAGDDDLQDKSARHGRSASGSGR